MFNQFAFSSKSILTLTAGINANVVMNSCYFIRRFSLLMLSVLVSTGTAAGILKPPKQAGLLLVARPNLHSIGSILQESRTRSSAYT